MTIARSRRLRWERRPEERPFELLDAALRVFATRGYRNTRLEEVAAAAGVTKGAVYHYFQNKEELLLRAIEAYQARAFGEVEEALQSERGSASTRVRLFFRKAFGGTDPVRDDVLRLLQGVAQEVPEVYEQWLVTGPVKGWRAAAALIRDGQASGEFRPDADAEVIARIVLTGLLGQMIWLRYEEQVPDVRIDRDRLIDSALDMLLAGLRPVTALRPRRGKI